MLALAAFGLRAYHLAGASLWYDELLQLDIAQGPLGQVWPQLPRHAAMPLDYFLLAGWVRLGRQEAWVRFPALAWGVLAVPLTYALAARLFNRRVGLLAAALLAGSSFAIDYSQEARPYALLLLLTLLAYLGLVQAYGTGRLRYWGLAGAGLAGAALTHYFTLFMLLPLGLFVAGQQLQGLRRKTTWGHTTCFGLCLFLLLSLFVLAGRGHDLVNVGGRFSTVVSNPASLTLPPAEKPNRGSGPPLAPAFWVDNVLAPLATPAEPFLLVYAAWLLLAVVSVAHPRPADRVAVLLLLGWLFLPIGLIYLFLLQRGTFFAPRYILYTLPAFLMLVAYGLEWLMIRGINLTPRPPSLQGKGERDQTPPPLSPIRGEKGERELPPSPFRGPSTAEGRWGWGVGFGRGSLVLLALVPLVLAEAGDLAKYYSAGSREDWRAVGRLLQAEVRPGDAVIAPKAEPAINWYYPPASAPFGTYSSNDTLWRILAERPRRWFILSSYSAKGDEGLRQWLAEQHAVTIAIDRRVVVYYHQEGLSPQQMLAQVKDFALPPNPLTYTTLATQYRYYGDVQTAHWFEQKALDLASPAPPRPLSLVGH